MLTLMLLNLSIPDIHSFFHTVPIYMLKMTSRLTISRLLQFCTHHPRVILGTTIFLSAAIYLANLKHRIDKTCRHISLVDLPLSSACRNFVEKGRRPLPPCAGWAWVLERGFVSFLSPWSDNITPPTVKSGGDDERQKTHWIPSFLALEVDLPVELLSGYPSDNKASKGEREEIPHLSQTFLRAFLDARSEGLEAYYLVDRDVPPLTLFEPGRRLFGREVGLGAFLLGTWFDTRGGGKSLRDGKFPKGVAQVPVCEGPSNTLRERWNEEDKEVAAAVMYWRAPDSAVAMVDNVAVKYGIPWRLMEGGFQEYMVERVDEKRVRLVYVTLEAQSLYPDGVKERNFRKISRLGYWGHGVYGQWLLWKTVKRLEKIQRERILA
ncbi:hypothetical protein B0T21DRAFT_181324 [Apiosordaria backusii]|uniref:Uncharacterized protein n=1 Tax=Apiosordaria backusii TaxID=314023 RepID=A0AA40ECN0_9PEZI|nr:hypothetical protein B0T21DRAFT_181324 [Apiosordaria backusii]